MRADHTKETYSLNSEPWDGMGRWGKRHMRGLSLPGPRGEDKPSDAYSCLHVCNEVKGPIF